MDIGVARVLIVSEKPDSGVRSNSIYNFQKFADKLRSDYQRNFFHEVIKLHLGFQQTSTYIMSNDIFRSFLYDNLLNLQ